MRSRILPRLLIAALLLSLLPVASAGAAQPGDPSLSASDRRNP